MTGITSNSTAEKSALAERLKKRHSAKELWQAFQFDIGRYSKYASAFMSQKDSLLRRIGVILTPSVTAILLYRIAHWLWLKERRSSAIFFTYLNNLLHKSYIHPSSNIGPGFYIAHTFGCIFEGNAGINFTLYPFSSITRLDTENMDTFSRMPLSEIGNEVTIALLCCMKSGCRIGDGVQIGPICHITKNIPQNSTVIGKNKNIQGTATRHSSL